MDIERITLLRKELETLEREGRSMANEELAKAVEAANAAIQRCELIATTFKLEFCLRGNDSTFYGEPQEIYGGLQTGWLSSSDFC